MKFVPRGHNLPHLVYRFVNQMTLRLATLTATTSLTRRKNPKGATGAASKRKIDANRSR
jgi:hypothetical protein